MNKLTLKNILNHEIDLINKPKKGAGGLYTNTFRRIVHWEKTTVNLSHILRETYPPFESRARALVNFPLEGEKYLFRFLILVDDSAPLMRIEESSRSKPAMFFTDDIQFLRANVRYLNAVSCALISLLEQSELDLDTNEFRKIQSDLKLQLHDKTVHYTRLDQAIDFVQMLSAIVETSDSTVFIEKPIMF